MKVERLTNNIETPLCRFAECCGSCRFAHVDWPFSEPLVYHCQKDVDGHYSPAPPKSSDNPNVETYDQWRLGREVRPAWVCDFYKEGSKYAEV